MKLTIHVKPNKKEEWVEKISNTEFVVYTKKPATEGKANEDTVRQLAEYFKIPKSNVSIKTGKTSKIKRIEIEVD